VEGRINLLLSASLSDDHREFARWFLRTHPESVVLVADGALWELAHGLEACEQRLVAKSYTSQELLATVRRLLIGPQSVA
jgi:hypothetical protein